MKQMLKQNQSKGAIPLMKYWMWNTGRKAHLKRNDFERGAEVFILAERLKEERLKARSYPGTTCSENRYKENLYLTH